MINEIPSAAAGLLRSAPAVQSQEAVASRGQGDPPPAAGASGEERNMPAEPQPLDTIVAQLNDYVQEVQRELRFDIDEENGEVVVKVVDARTQDVVREIPPEEIREMRKRLDEASEKIFERAQGRSILFHAKA